MNSDYIVLLVVAIVTFGLGGYGIYQSRKYQKKTQSYTRVKGNIMAAVPFDTLKAFEKLVNAGVPPEHAKAYVALLLEVMIEHEERFTALYSGSTI